MQVLSLPKPEIEKNQLMKSLNLRRTEKSFGSNELTQQMLSDLLWAGYGVNRSEDGKRTAPSAHDWQQIDIYVSDTKGLYLYDAQHNTLISVLTEDIRAMTGIQEYPRQAPISLIYVLDESKMDNRQPEQVKTNFSYATAGAIAQNVYLFCAAEGLNAAVRGDIERDELHKKMRLRNDQKILLAQSVGYPATGLKQWIKNLIKK